MLGVWGRIAMDDDALRKNDVLDDPDGMYYDDHATREESFQTRIRRARARERDGQPLTLGDRKALRAWAISNANRVANGYLSPHRYDRGPSKRVVERLKTITELQLVEGLNLAQIGERLGVSANLVSQTIKRYPKHFEKILHEVSERLAEDATLIKPAVYGRLIEKMRVNAMRAPEVIDEIMNDPDQPGGVRLQATKLTLDAFDVGKNTQNHAQTPLSDDSKRLLADTIGVITALAAAAAPLAENDEKCKVIEAEVIDVEPISDDK